MPLPPRRDMPKFGTRITMYFLARAVTEYLRHKVNVDADVPDDLKAALNVLADLLPEIISINPPGPE